MLKKLIHESVFHVNNSCGLIEILSFIIFKICLQDHDELIKKLSVSTIALVSTVMIIPNTNKEGCCSAEVKHESVKHLNNRIT